MRFLGRPRKHLRPKRSKKKLQWACALGCTHAADDSDDVSDDGDDDHNDAAVILPPEQLQLDADLKQEMEMDRELWNKCPGSTAKPKLLWFLRFNLRNRGFYFRGCVIPVAYEAYRQRLRP